MKKQNVKFETFLIYLIKAGFQIWTFVFPKPVEIYTHTITHLQALINGAMDLEMLRHGSIYTLYRALPLMPFYTKNCPRVPYSFSKTVFQVLYFYFLKIYPIFGDTSARVGSWEALVQTIESNYRISLGFHDYFLVSDFWSWNF